MLKVLALFRVVFKSIRRHYQTVERKAGMGGAQLWALSHVARNPGIRVGELAQALAIHQSTASNLVRDLQRSALVTRRRVGKDQRSVALYATPKGAAVLKRAPQPLIGVLQQALSDLATADLTVMRHKLERLVGVMHRGERAARSTPLSQI